MTTLSTGSVKQQQVLYGPCETSTCQALRQDFERRTVYWRPNVSWNISKKHETGHWSNPKIANVMARHTTILSYPEGSSSYQRPIKYGEIGVFKGDTLDGVARILPPGSTVHMFDFDSAIQASFHWVGKIASSRNITMIGHVVEGYEAADYNLDLAQLCMKIQNGEEEPFDFVYLDGAHTFRVDALAFIFVDCILRKGGLVAFDDYHWTMARSPTVGKQKSILEKYPHVMLVEPQVHMVVELVVKRLYGYDTVEEELLYRKG